MLGFFLCALTVAKIVTSSRFLLSILETVTSEWGILLDSGYYNFSKTQPAMSVTST